jgi:hypothetical protein
MLGGILKNVTKLLGPAGIAIDILGGLMSSAKSSGAGGSGQMNIAELQSARIRLQDQLGQVSVLRQQLNIGQNGAISINISSQPMPFSAAQGSPLANAMQNPFDALGPLKQLLGSLMPALGKMLEALGGGGSATAAGGSTAAPSSGGGVSGSQGSGGSSAPAIGGDSQGWGAIDSMMAEAEKLAKSKNPSDQLRAQQLMNQAQQMFQTISKLLQQMSEMFKTAIGNIK